MSRPRLVIAMARLVFVFGSASLFVLSGLALLAAPASAAPIGTPPSISPGAASSTDSPQPGDTLIEVPAAWDGSPGISIQWVDCDNTGNNCVPISGATGSSYKVAPSDKGFTIEVQETATDGTGTKTLSSGPTLVVGLPPTVVSPPTISGTAERGQELTAVNGAWSNNPTSLSHQWLRCDDTGNSCAAIIGATGQKYTLTSADVGNTVKVEETASNAGGTGTRADSSSSAVVTPPPPMNQTLPTITGTAQEGQTLTEHDGTWSNNPTLSHQWLDCNSSGNTCSPVAANGTGQTYILTAADVGRTIRVQESGLNGGRSGAPVSSVPTVIVTAATVGLSTTTTTLLALPANPVTNQTVSLIATVTSSSAAAPPAGTVAFQNAGAPISGCSSIHVATVNQSVNVMCQTAFSASGSPAKITASFTPATGANISRATSQALALAVGQDSSTTSLTVSASSVRVGSKATYTATVAAGHAGPFEPSGAVQFLDHGKTISSCSSQLLALSKGSLSAECTVIYKKTRGHAIAAQYVGDAAFRRSASSGEAVTIQPARVLGTIKSRMSWRFHFTPKFTTVLQMLMRQVRTGARIAISCRGRGCPFQTRSLVVTTIGCHHASSRSCSSTHSRSVDLVSRFAGHRLPAGSVVTVELTLPNWIGKAYVFSILRGRGPRFKILCLAPGSTRPGVGCHVRE